MAKSSSEFSVNERVHHGVYGTGTISRTDEQHTIIQFDQNGVRKFITSMVQLEHSDVEAPKRARAKARKPRAKK